jgi:hypothetical protein
MTLYRVCRFCGMQISGRVDKKFCDDHCRSNYNNRLRSSTAAEIRTVNSILRHNRKILNTLVTEEGEMYILKSRLDEKGFNFNFYTQTHTAENGDMFSLCYDYAYRQVDELRVKVMRWKTELSELF